MFNENTPGSSKKELQQAIFLYYFYLQTNTCIHPAFAYLTFTLLFPDQIIVDFLNSIFSFFTDAGNLPAT